MVGDSTVCGWVLGIDTSSEIASLALAPTAPDLVGADITWRAGRTQTASLLAQIDHLFRLNDIGSEALGAVVVATGPGGFNALRVGLSVAKGFAFALNIPIFGVGTLDISAQSVAHWGLPVRAFVPAGRTRAVYADYAHLGGRLQQFGEVGNRRVPDLAADLTTATILVGDMTTGEAQAMRTSPFAVVPPAAQCTRRAAFMIDLAMPRWQNSEPDDLMDLEPLYIHQQPS